MIKESVDLDGVEIIVEYLGPIIGASTGPGTMSIYCYGKEVTVNPD
jgi:fatty acid-binding protein DegV